MPCLRINLDLDVTPRLVEEEVSPGTKVQHRLVRHIIGFRIVDQFFRISGNADGGLFGRIGLSRQVVSDLG